MLADAFFEQGLTHEVCEDYARHGADYAVLSDGCSNGGGPRIDADWGARLLCLAAEANISTKDGKDPVEYVQQIAEAAKHLYHNLLPMSPEGMCATLLTLRPILFYLPTWNFLQATIIGDGVSGGKRKDGTWVIRSVEFAHSAPYYLKYRMFKENDQWAKVCSKSFTVRTYAGDLFNPSLAFPPYWPITYREEKWQSVMSFQEEQKELDFEKPFEVFEYPLDEFEFAFIASDGVHAFFTPVRNETNKHNEPIHFLDVLRVLLDIRGYRPGFMRLQRHWNFKQDRPGTFKRLNWQHGDDVSVGAVCCG